MTLYAIVKKDEWVSSEAKSEKPRKKTRWVIGKNVFLGTVFGRLTITSIHPSNENDPCIRFECQCECGKFITTRATGVTSGNCKSCGCLNKEIVGNLNRTHGESGTPGNADSPEYTSWECMRDRCYNKNKLGYCNYGGRGITVCERWDSYENFLEDMGRKPPGFTIERIDVNGNYCKENCRWATMKEQLNNTRRNIKCTYQGETGSLMSIVERLGLTDKYQNIRARLKRGTSLEQIIEDIKSGKWGRHA